MEIRLAKIDETAELAAISKRAFDTDIRVGADEIGGPDDYDDAKWHEKMRRSGHLYSILEDGALVGGMLLFRDKKDPGAMYVGRLFVSPELHRRGIGTRAMLEVEKLFRDIDLWRLETPVWNSRTNAFYPKLGYVEMMRDGESVYYQKRVIRLG